MKSVPLKAAALAALLLASAALAACNRTATDDKVFGDRVRAYLLEHPEVIQEAVQKLQDRQEQAALAQTTQAIPRLRAAIERDPHDFVVNPAGKITVTEFYDYRCPHCANVAPKVAAFIKEHPDVRFVFKESPIFGPTSEHAARAALAVKADGGDYLGLYQALMTAHGLDDEMIDKLAAQHGARPATLASADAAKAANEQLARTAQLFHDLALGGTPSFIVGDQVVPGEDMDAVRTLVAQLLAKKS